MVAELEQRLTQQGFKRVNNLEEIAHFKRFFIDTNHVDSTRFPVYPVTKKVNLTHDLMNLYGIHWRYLINNEDFHDFVTERGDINLVLNEANQPKKEQRFAKYAFTKKYLDNHQSLWLFMPETPSWDIYENLILPRFSADMQEYREVKKKIKC